MINHFRTLLLNDNSDGRPSYGRLGEEFVPASFSPLPLNSTRSKVRQALFGTANDPLYQNYILAVVLGAVHACEYTDEFAQGLDSRIAYDTSTISDDDFGFGRDVVTTSSTNMRLEFMTDGHPTAAGQAQFSFTITTDAGPSLKVYEARSNITREYDLAVTGERSSIITLPSSATMRVVVPAGSWDVGVSFYVTSRTIPYASIVSIYSDLAGLGEETLTNTFNNTPTSLYNLWTDSLCIADRVAGLVGAHVYGLEKQRNGSV